MNRLAKWIMRLYPARWRRRYGDELDALLTDTGADARVVADLLQGGIRMQAKTWSFPKLAVVLGMGGFLLSAGFALLLPNEFTSKATLQVTPAQGGTAPRLNESIQQMVTTVLSRTSLAAIINDPHLLLYKEELKTTPLEDVIEEMKNNIRITLIALPGTLGKRATAFDIVFSYYDRFKAQQTVARLVEGFRAGLSAEAAWQLGHPENAGQHYLDVLDVASLPVDPVFPSRRAVELIGAILGLSIVVAYRKIRKKSFAASGFAASAIVFGLLGGLAGDGASISNLLGNQWRSAALMSAPNATPEQIAELSQEVLSRTSLSSVIQDPRLRLYTSQLKTKPVEDVMQTMKQHLSIAPVGDGRYFTVSFVYSDRFKAQQTVQTITDRLNEANRRLYGSLPAAPATPLPSLNLEVLDVPSLPVQPTKPNRPAIAITGGTAGVLAGALVALVRRRWKPEANIPVDAVNG